MDTKYQMASPIPRTVNVIRTQTLTPNMIRITVGGPNLEGFPEGQESGYIKLMFPHPGETELFLASSDNASKGKKPLMRTYSIRTFDADTLEMEIDFVVHGDNGPASAWAIGAKEGDTITLAGPGAKKMVDLSADWFFIVGDMTALPAISVNLEKMPRDARGYAVIEIIDYADKQELNAPENMQLHWVVNPHPDQPNTILPDAVEELPWMEGTANVWVAGEFETMRTMRRYFKKDRGVGRKEIYASSYWKIGETDEGNKAAKRRDPEAD